MKRKQNGKRMSLKEKKEKELKERNRLNNMTIW
jgi:hypothetical protein